MPKSTAEGAGGTIKDSLILYLDAANTNSYPGSGTTWKDLSSTVANGTLTNGAVYSNTNAGTISLDGVDDYVNIGNKISLLAPTLPLTTEIWIYINNNSPNSGCISLDSRGPSISTYYGINLSFVNTTNTVLFGISYGDGIGNNDPTHRQTAGTAANFVTNTWYHVVGIVENAIANSKIYVNGVSQALTTSGTGGALAWSGGLGTGRVGGNWGPGTPTMAGRIAVAKVYRRALTQAEVTQNYNALKGRFGL
jgi:hypothetical protein